ncbi:aminodeoxychorismate/anthranilate synthase component II [Dongia mobilis]|jgi:anthranilate synthase component 2|uniref:anthranilate synthase component II n=1 Tax=Dongia sp. TaxID=1977262 RepID=UPI0026F2FE7C
MFILIDNYDSFTYNLYHYLGELGAEIEVYRNDQISVDEVMAKAPQGIILSPGPRDPDRAGICLDLIKAASGKIPILGVCLGHQAIGQAFGGKVVRADKPMHGKMSKVSHHNKSVFLDIPNNFAATRYHSLVVERESLPPELEITAETADGTIMGLAHKTLPIAGVQFHPESIASEHGHKLLGNFLTSAGMNKLNMPNAAKVLQ